MMVKPHKARTVRNLILIVVTGPEDAVQYEV